MLTFHYAGKKKKKPGTRCIPLVSPPFPHVREKITMASVRDREQITCTTMS
jgi:hypothetical protein